MYNTFKQHIETSFPFLREAKILLAISGGVDSVVLTNLCQRLQLNITLAHCNFNLRAKESDTDEQFVVNLANRLNIEIFTQHFNTNEYAETQKVSIQVAARILRYQWFNDLCTGLNFDYVLTAHHADDSLETFIINLSRGTGIEGLTGIPATNKNIIRPLLSFSRQEILAYASTNNIQWREDSSNEETKYLRNKIRQELVPVLKELHPQFLSNFISTQHYLYSSSQVIKTHITELRASLFENENDMYNVSIKKILQLNPIAPYLFELFKDFGFKQWKDVHDLLKAQSGKQLFSDTHRMLKDREYLIVDKYDVNSDSSKEEYQITENEISILIPVKLTFTEVQKIEEKDISTIYVDKEKLNFPLSVRKWRIGDYFYPYGLKGKKKLSKFFKDEKYSLRAKESQWLLCSGNDIVWVIRKRADDRFKIIEKTNQILKIQLD